MINYNSMNIYMQTFGWPQKKLAQINFWMPFFCIHFHYASHFEICVEWWNTKKNLNFEHLWWLKYSKGCCFYYDYLFCNFHDENSWFMKWTMDSVSPLFLWSILVNSRENSLSSYFSSIDPNVLERSLASAAIYIALNP